MYENITTVIGNVASEVRTRITANGHTAASFRLASTTRRFDRSKGGWADTDTNFYTVQCWRQMADNVRRSLSTGEPVIVHGRLKQREWEDADGRRVSHEIEAYAVGHDMNKGTSSFVRIKAQEPQPNDERNDVFQELAESFMNQTAAEPALESADSAPAEGTDDVSDGRAGDRPAVHETVPSAVRDW